MNINESKRAPQPSEARTGLNRSVVDYGFRGLLDPELYEFGLSCFEDACYLNTNDFELVASSSTSTSSRS